MANQRLTEVLAQYTGDEESLNAFVTAAEEELGSDWTQTIYADMDGVSDDIRERLDHAFNYYAAMTAWNELQSYLMQQTPLDYQETLERVPVLEHWLSFFGGAGEEAITQLKEKLRTQGEATHQNTERLDNPFIQDNIVSSENDNAENNMTGIEVTQEQINDIFSDTESSDFMMQDNVSEHPQDSMYVSQSLADMPNEQEEVSHTDIISPVQPIMSDVNQDIMPSDTVADTVQEDIPNEQIPQQPQVVEHTDVFDPIAVQQPAQNDTPLQSENENMWRVHRIFRQIDFVTNVQAWISFLCLELGYTDFYTYRHYGFLVDVLDKTVLELKEILAEPDLYELMNSVRPNGVKVLQDKLIAYERQAQEGHEMLSDYEPLMPLTTDDLKNKLGALDLSGEKEYLGPAPDGFEMIDDPYEHMNDDDLKKEYEKIEAQGNLDTSTSVQPVQNVSPTISDTQNQQASVKNTSQTPQNGVQRKMSFTFGAKPAKQPTQTNGDAS